MILLVATVLYTVALMIRAEYKYQKFKYYLGLADSPIAENDDIYDSVTDDNEEEKQQ